MELLNFLNAPDEAPIVLANKPDADACNPATLLVVSYHSGERAECNWLRCVDGRTELSDKNEMRSHGTAHNNRLQQTVPRHWRRAASYLESERVSPSQGTLVCIVLAP